MRLEAPIRESLQAFFGADTPLEILPLAAGRSARGVFKVVAAGRAFVLRLGHAGFSSSAWLDEQRYAQLAADAGVGPQLQRVEPEHGLVLMDWIESGAVVDSMTPIAASLAALHRCPAYPLGLCLLDWLDEQHHRALLTLPSGPVREAVLQWRPLRAAVQKHATYSACHQELNPGNILFCADVAWLIDWESAGRGDPLYDLANVANWFLWYGEALQRLLRLYFQREASEQELLQTTRLRAVHFLFLLLVSLQHDGLLADEADALRWPEFLVQPGLAARWRSKASTAQRQACLAQEVVRWQL